MYIGPIERDNFYFKIDLDIDLDIDIIAIGLFTIALHFSVVAGIMIIAGILHPQEFWDLASGLLYFLTIPSGYLLLTIFMFTNMHNVSWGK